MPQKLRYNPTLNKGNWAAIIPAVAVFFVIHWMLPANMQMKFFGENGMRDITPMNVYYAVLVGLAVGGLISAFTEYYTGLGKKPVLGIVQNLQPVPQNPISLRGFQRYDFYFWPNHIICRAIWAVYSFCRFYGVALAASAMMATTAMQLAIDAFGPIADNAGGIAEMSELPK